MRAPKKIYWVEITGGPGLGYAERGGGKFTVLKYAQDRVYDLEHKGKTAEIYETQELVWTRVTDETVS